MKVAVGMALCLLAQFGLNFSVNFLEINDELGFLYRAIFRAG